MFQEPSHFKRLHGTKYDDAGLVLAQWWMCSLTYVLSLLLPLLFIDDKVSILAPGMLSFTLLLILNIFL